MNDPGFKRELNTAIKGASAPKEEGILHLLY